LQNNMHRTRGIIQLVRHIKSNYDGDILIVSPRTDHIRLMEMIMLDEGIKCAVITGTTKNRKDIFQKVLEGEYPVTIATTSIMSEGASNPRWHHVISTMPFSDPKTAIQLTGRAIRKAEGKKYGYFWDLVDVNPMCRSMCKSRWRAIKKFLGGHRVHSMSALPPYSIDAKAS
jgi:superfamily II DNA or RNA helicase